MNANAGTATISLSERAVARVAEMLSQENQGDLMLRISVSGGGCSGFQYGFSFDDAVNADDRVFQHGPVKAVVDEMSLELLGGARVIKDKELVASGAQS